MLIREFSEGKIDDCVISRDDLNVVHFYSNNSSVSNPFEKAQLYDEFDYIESNCILDSYLNTHNR